MQGWTHKACLRQEGQNLDGSAMRPQQSYKEAGQAGGIKNGLRQQAKTHCPLGHPYAGENLYVAPNGSRQCRMCKRFPKGDKSGKTMDRT